MSQAQSYNVTAAHITQTPGVCGGEPCIAERRIKARNVYFWYAKVGMSAREIAEDYNLSLTQVHAALTFAYENVEAIEKAIRDEEIFVEEFKKNYPSKIIHLLGDEPAE